MFFAGSRNRGARWKDEGGSPLPWRPFIDAVGSGISASDDAALARTLISVSGGGSVDWAAMGIYRPQDYGTIDPTGASDSSTAIQAAITARNASNYGGVVDIPPGTYKISNGLTDTDPGYDSTHGWGYGYGRKIRGSAWGATTLKAASGLTSPILTVTGNDNPGLPTIDIQDIAFNGNANTGMSNGVVKLDRVVYVRMQRVAILGATGGSTLAPIGLKVIDSLGSVYDQCHFVNCQTGVLYDSVPIYGNSLVTFRQCMVLGSSTIGIDFVGTSLFASLVIDGLDLEGGNLTTAGVRVRGVSGTQAHSVWIRGPIHYEGNGGANLFDIDAKYARINGPITETGIGGGVRVNNRTTSSLVITDWPSVSVTNASGATLRLERCPSASYSGGTTVVGY